MTRVLVLAGAVVYRFIRFSELLLRVLALLRITHFRESGLLAPVLASFATTQPFNPDYQSSSTTCSLSGCSTHAQASRLTAKSKPPYSK